MSEWVVGRIPVIECLRAGRRTPRQLFLLRGGSGLEGIEGLAKTIPIRYCDRHELNSIVPDIQHQGVILQADPLPVYGLREWLENKSNVVSTLVVLDEIVDPHNFGAIVRSAVAFGIAAVVFCERHAAPLSPVALKSAAGGMEYIDLIRVKNLMHALEEMKEVGYWAYGLDPNGPQSMWETDLTGKIVFVIGSEGKGLRRLIRERCDKLIRIPTCGKISSLNASVSAALVFFELNRQRACSKVSSK